MSKTINEFKASLIYDFHENNLPEGVYNINSNPNKIIIKSNTSLQLFSKENQKGNSIILNNTDKQHMEIDVNKILESNALSSVGSTKVTSTICLNGNCNTKVIENFGNQEIKDTCHYICSSLNWKNAIFFIIILILIYYVIIGFISN